MCSIQTMYDFQFCRFHSLNQSTFSFNCNNLQDLLHPLVDLGEETSNDLEPTKTNETRKQSIQRCMLSLKHACGCTDTQCQQLSCSKMKGVIAHTKLCKRKATRGCVVCRQLIALCCYHSNNCTEAKCLIPFCPNVKHKLTQQQLDQRYGEQFFSSFLYRI